MMGSRDRSSSSNTSVTISTPTPMSPTAEGSPCKTAELPSIEDSEDCKAAETPSTAGKQIKFAVQLFKLNSGEYLLDFKKLGGDTFGFFNCCSVLLVHLSRTIVDQKKSQPGRSDGASPCKVLPTAATAAPVTISN